MNLHKFWNKYILSKEFFGLRHFSICTCHCLVAPPLPHAWPLKWNIEFYSWCYFGCPPFTSSSATQMCFVGISTHNGMSALPRSSYILFLVCFWMSTILPFICYSNMCVCGHLHPTMGCLPYKNFLHYQRTHCYFQLECILLWLLSFALLQDWCGTRVTSKVKPYEYNYPMQRPVHACMYHVCLLTTIVGPCMGRWKVGTVIGIGEYVTPSNLLCKVKAWFWVYYIGFSHAGVLFLVTQPWAHMNKFDNTQSSHALIVLLHTSTHMQLYMFIFNW